MKKFALSLSVSSAALLLAANLAWAEAAPVYDVEAFNTGAGAPYQGAQQNTGESQAGQAANVPQYAREDFAVHDREPSLSLEQRVQRAERQIKTIQSSEAAMQVESLQGQVQTLRGQVEQLTRQLAKAESAQRSMYQDVDKRLAELKATIQSGAVIAAADVKKESKKQVARAESKAKAKQLAKKDTNQPNVAEEQKIYQTAYDFIKARKYDKAVDALNGMLKKYPEGQFASNAHYWLGELYGLMGKNDEALIQFTTVLNKFPDSPRVADAQLKIGLIFAAQSKWLSAKRSFKKVVHKFPGTASSRLATEQLKQIKKAGH